MRTREEMQEADMNAAFGAAVYRAANVFHFSKGGPNEAKMQSRFAVVCIDAGMPIDEPCVETWFNWWAKERGWA